MGLLRPSLERQLKTFRMPAAITTAVSGDRYVTAELAPEAGGWVFVDVEEQCGFPMQPPAALVTAASDAALATAAEASLAAQTADGSWSPATSVPTLLLAMLADLNLGWQAPQAPLPAGCRRDAAHLPEVRRAERRTAGRVACSTMGSNRLDAGQGQQGRQGRASPCTLGLS